MYGIASHRQVDDEHFAYMIACPVKNETGTNSVKHRSP